jgi:cholinesterase
MKSAFAVVPLLAIVQVAFASGSVPAKLQVKTQTGVVQGHNAVNRSDVFEFLGLPYAKAPLGDLRFAPPEKATSQDQTPILVADTWVLT